MNHSRKSIAAFLVAALPLAYACKTADVSPTNRITLQAYQSGRVQNDITVRADSVNDSRCPEGVVCIWGGNAVVRATLSKAAEQKQVRLVLGPDPTVGYPQRADSTGVVFAGTTYKVILRDVTPYPSFTKPSQSPTQAIIEVSKL
ncbi:hypothetical protein [Fibrivirga algicola]|uniref:Lipoprotein n=1 Tax=Fibrivirga algicola TaxID=2950420 RepID=A0ABX0QDM4_9BACT|nr:hypothetical protein [Fibrivirga algicola]NID09062.1 hypothetical protein [Fibrivirga algicola]